MAKQPAPELIPFLDSLAEMVADQIVADGISPEQVRTAAANHCKKPRTTAAKLRDAVQHAQGSKVVPDERR